MELSKNELRVVYRALKECKKRLELPERIGLGEQIDINEYKSIMDKIEGEFNE